jgi:phage portal protein BeeE
MASSGEMQGPECEAKAGHVNATKTMAERELIHVRFNAISFLKNYDNRLNFISIIAL